MAEVLIFTGAVHHNTHKFFCHLKIFFCGCIVLGIFRRKGDREFPPERFLADIIRDVEGVIAGLQCHFFRLNIPFGMDVISHFDPYSTGDVGSGIVADDVPGRAVLAFFIPDLSGFDAGNDDGLHTGSFRV